MSRRGTIVLLSGLLLLVSLGAAGAAAQEAPADPDTDVIGWEAGYWHNESIAVNQSDGLSAEERAAFVGRSMARIEVLREREFKRSVPVEVVSREAFGNQTPGNASANYSAWNNQVWEALFVVGEGDDVQELLHSTATARSTGGYFYGVDEIRIIADDPERATLSRGTLVHELVHAQQDQYVNLTDPRFVGDTQDEQLAVDGLLEGEANYLEARYEERCGIEWDCVSGGGAAGGDSDLNLGLFLTLFFPYSDGPPYVHSLVEAGGWAAVDAAYENPPNSTEQVIHHVEEAPRPIEVEDEARAGWEPFAGPGRNGTDVAGEASIFTMLWYQARTVDADTVDPFGTGRNVGRYDTYDYEAPPSAGWAGDAIRPYRKPTPDGTAYGYVWVTGWDTAVDAGEFRSAYLAVLDARDACQVGTRTWVVEDGPFADAFRVVQERDRVTIVNGPQVGDLEHLRPNATASESIDTAACDPPTSVDADPDGSAGPSGTAGTDPDMRAPSQPGFGAVLALLAVAALLVVATRRRP